MSSSANSYSESQQSVSLTSLRVDAAGAPHAALSAVITLRASLSASGRFAMITSTRSRSELWTMTLTHGVGRDADRQPRQVVMNEPPPAS